jgi:uncharacterized protein (UPF0335 family)
MALDPEDYEELVGGSSPTDSYRLTAGELRSFIERIERVALEIRAAQDDQKEIYAEAKARGYDVPTMKRIVALRKKQADDIAEQEALEGMYREALGLPPLGSP